MAKTEIIEDRLLRTIRDRRLLPNVPDPEAIRNNNDRRNGFEEEGQKKQMQSGTRYHSEFPVTVTFVYCKTRFKLKANCVNISTSGILLDLSKTVQGYEARYLEKAKSVKLKFKVPAGAMPEGLEMRVKVSANLVRKLPDSNKIAFVFTEELLDYAGKKKDRFALFFSSFFLGFTVLFITLMRSGSIVYFESNKTMYLYSIIAAVFLLSRYFCGMLYKAYPIDPDFTPGVTIIVPCFNEETWIQQTILSCMNQDYPVDKLEVLIMDDCSTDASIEKIKEITDRLGLEEPRYRTKERIKYVKAEINKGKREVLAVGAKIAKHEMLVFVDSDSFLSPYAIRNIVQPFKDPKMGGVSGRCDVANTYTNALTKMQSVRYYIAFRIMKSAESVFDAVTCLSGPLACYKKSIVLENSDAWLNQSFLGQRATFGDDRAMTNFVLKDFRTYYQDTATCATIVPNTYNVFLKQQMRWKRSWLRESLIAGKYMWRKEPFAAVFFYMGLAVPILSPAIVLYNLVYVPLTLHVFPTTFITGIFLMSSLMSLVQLLLKKSTTWLYGFFFCLFYEAVLLWQMPVAMFTFWKSTWGTRMTPEDLAEQAKKAKDEETRREFVTI